MGTRGFTGFVIENQVKASYQQYDSYPSGVGMDVLKYARALADGAPEAIINLRKQLARKVMVNESDRPTPEQIATLAAAGYTAQSVSTGDDFYAWLREDQGQPGRLADAPFMLDSAAFGEDPLFCEWGYLINTDDQTVEVYTGYLTRGSKRWPTGVSLVATFRLSALPSDEEFLALDAQVDALYVAANA